MVRIGQEDRRTGEEDRRGEERTREDRRIVGQLRTGEGRVGQQDKGARENRRLNVKFFQDNLVQV